MAWLHRWFKRSRIESEEEESEGNLQQLENIVMFSSGSPANPIVDALLKFARIQMSISRRAHKQTRHIIGLTWTLALLTAALLAFTIHLEQDAKRNRKRDEAKQLGQAKPEIQLTVPY